MPASQQDAEGRKHLISLRETVESIWIAIVLAFVLRSFVLEAFVIPTGSMAPRLMGQHWQFECPACGYHYAYGIPRNPEGEAPRLSAAVRQPRGAPAACPSCGHQKGFGREWAYFGDRVLVLKYLYRFRQPAPWDVVVFKNPQDNEQNYIKRLIALPGQQIEIVHGDIFYRDGKDFNGDGVIDEKDFEHERAAVECPLQILRKPAKTQRVMWQVIFDNDYQPDPEIYTSRDGRPWVSPWRKHRGAEAWDLTGEGGRVFRFAGPDEEAELRFVADRRRFCPNYAYNQPSRTPAYDEKTDINSDLNLSFTFTPETPRAEVGLHLSSFSHHFRARLSADGSYRLEHGLDDGDGQIRWEDAPWDSGRREPLLVGHGYQVTLMHVDRRVALWVDGKEVLHSPDRLYRADREQILGAVLRGVPTPMVAILASGGPARLSHVHLMRDVYYTCPTIHDNGHDTRRKGWGTTGNPMVLRKFLHKPDLDEFFVLGDNSPSSKDSRMWGHHADTLHAGYRDGTVPRYNMIGKAFFVYWPGGYRLPLLKGLPIIPNVGRMRLIR